jgi:MFS family permease
MDEFSYLSVLLSIILGLAVTQILQGFRALLLSRRRVRLYWPGLTLAGLLLVIFAQNWWAMFGLRGMHDWTFLGFAVVLFHMILHYMLAALVLPDVLPNESINLHEHYYAHHGWFFSIAALDVFVSLLKDLVLTGSLTDHTNLAFHLVFISSALTAALTKREWFHKIAAIFIAVLFAFYIALLFVHLR